MDETTTQGEQPEPAAVETTAANPEDFKKLQDALKEANKESAARRKKLEAYEKAEADRKAAEMTDIEKAKAETDRMKSELAAARRDAVAARHNLPPELADRLRGDTAEEMEADAAKIAAFVTAKPTAAPPVSPTAPSTAPALTLDSMSKMTTEQINKNWEAVSAALAKQGK